MMAFFQHNTKAFNNINKSIFFVASLWYYGHVENSGLFSSNFDMSLVVGFYFLQLKWWLCTEEKKRQQRYHPTSNKI